MAEDPNANETQNPLGRLTIKDIESNSYINTNARITWTVIDGLKLSAFGSYTYNVKENSKYTQTILKQDKDRVVLLKSLITRVVCC